MSTLPPCRARRYSLAFLTIPDIGPLEAIHVAARAGYQMVGLRLLPATAEERPYPLLSSRQLLRDVVAALDDNGISVGDLEIIRLKPDTDPETFIPFFEKAHFLKARHVTVVNDDPLDSRTIDTFSRLCETAQAFNLTMNLEPMPWTATQNIAQAVHILAQSRQSNAGLLVDSFHFHRSHSRLEQLHALPPDRFNVFQISDAPATFDPTPDAIRHQARTARCLPGHGELDLASLITHIPARATVSIEVPNRQLLRDYSPLDRAVLALAATRRLYDQPRLRSKV